MLDLQNFQRMLCRLEVPKQKKPPSLKPPTMGEVDLEEWLCDFHARIPKLMAEVRKGTLVRAALDIGIASVIFIIYSETKLL